MKWRARVFAWAAAWAGLAATLAAADPGFDFEALRARAKGIAGRAYVAPKGEVPEWLKKLSYDELRRIEFDGRRSLWHEEHLPFQVQYLHPGFIFDRSVRLFEIQGSQVAPVPFRREYFNYRALEAGELPATMGFAGFRLMFPLGGPAQPYREIGSFAGASYFRFLGVGAAYGLSARGLALNTAESGPEEFPRFTEFWLTRPAADASHLVAYALLESESAAGAYQFSITPGVTTVVDVKMAVYFRQPLRVAGIAPLTSMFWHGENSNTGADDFRPEVHDSDGLLMHNGAGEWIWRPLVNPRQLRVATFADENPRGFGLLQRDRNFENYQDLEASYHVRPSAWVEPLGGWGRGGVRLVEIPTASETDDNVVAFWVPEKNPSPGEALELAYRLHWYVDHPRPPAGFVRATRQGKSAIYEPGFERFVVDFDGVQLQALGAEARPEPVVSVGAGARLHHASAQKNPINGTWRVAFTIKPDDPRRPVELRCFLRRSREALTETWSQLWQP